MRLNHAWELTKKALIAWNNDNTMPLGAALAYYASFSISPLLVIALAVSGLFYRGDSISYVRMEIADLVGDKPATVIVAAIESVRYSEHGLAATIVSLIVLFLGASGVFVQLQNSLNQIWGVKPKPGHFVRDFLKQRLVSFAMILGVSFLLLVSLLESAAVAAITAYFHYLLPDADFAWYTLDNLGSFLLVVFIFAAIFKVVPDVHIDWSDVWVGAFVTAVLFTGGKSLIGLYLGRSGIGSAFGAAASVYVILAWVYYSSQILFLGAEFTKVYSEHHRFCVRPVRGAETITEEARQRARGEMEKIDSERAKKSA
jgi:membrane protein